ncbi:ISL3 family transposase [Carbonactinospora thermoautotrophica]|uniref:ISL3 family transposase n=1 Tax=Carbonactinospora thermoautotrophica TaxID=1469144 RepID=UPI00082DFEF0
MAGWIIRNPRTLDPGEEHQLKEHQLKAILARCPHRNTVHGHVRAFARMMRPRRGDRLTDWMATVLAADLPEPHSFATGLRRDRHAVTAGLTLPWSFGPVEGHINRIKMLKRQMYGRANPDLLRTRVLLAD